MEANNISRRPWRVGIDSARVEEEEVRNSGPASWTFPKWDRLEGDGLSNMVLAGDAVKYRSKGDGWSLSLSLSLSLRVSWVRIRLTRESRSGEGGRGI
jgi:hypothetical protein